MSSESLQKLMLAAPDLAVVLGVSTSYIWRMHSSGKIPLPRKLGRRTAWSAKEIDRWIDAGCPPREIWLKDSK